MSRRKSSSPSEDLEGSLQDERPAKTPRLSQASAPRQRRAARACDRCRGSKLRCIAGVPPETRCNVCLKAGTICVYTNPAPPQVPVDNAPGPSSDTQSHERLDRLEAGLARLVGLLDPSAMMHAPSSVQPSATALMPAVATDSTWEMPLSEDIMPALMEYPPFSDTSFSSALDNPLPVPLPPAVATAPFRPPSSVHFVSPGSQNTDKRPSTTSSPATHLAEARPLPRYRSNSRMDAFSPEAPFRSVTYNPDTYINAEITDQHEELHGTVGISTSGSKTPKRGKGDPLDLGVIEETLARQLFTVYLEEISFFMPILQEPITFDAMRHQSSFLLSTVLAIAAKYCVNTTPPSGSPIVDEPTWTRIRALATTSYLQAHISKVHCLEDVQATLLLAAWGLQDRGASPDPWILTGTAHRLARRLGIHQAVHRLASGEAPSARGVACLKTWLCLYVFDHLFSVGFGRPETDGFDGPSVNCESLLRMLDGSDTSLTAFCQESAAASLAAYVEIAKLAKGYRALVGSLDDNGNDLSRGLQQFASRWIWDRSPLSGKLGRARKPVRLMYHHIRLCLYAIPRRIRVTDGSSASTDTAKVHECASAIIQTFTDDLREDEDTMLCFAYDYAYMLLAHAAAILMNMSRGNQGEALQPAVMSSCAQAITAMVSSDRSAIRFPTDLANNLRLIAKEMGMELGGWVSADVIAKMDNRCDDDTGINELLGLDWSLFDFDLLFNGVSNGDT